MNSPTRACECKPCYVDDAHQVLGCRRSTGRNLPESVGLMSASDLVDAARARLDHGERTTVPSLPDVADWNAFESARAALGQNPSRTKRAARYGIRTAA
jgi:hypothetical protein